MLWYRIPIVIIDFRSSNKTVTYLSTGGRYGYGLYSGFSIAQSPYLAFASDSSHFGWERIRAPIDASCLARSADKPQIAPISRQSIPDLRRSSASNRRRKPAWFLAAI